MSRVIVIQKEIEALEAELKAIQKECSHPKPAIISINKGDTGNYDPTQDHYWTEHHCTLCDERWNTDQ